MRYRFDAFTVDTESYSIAEGDSALRVRPKVFDLICYLIAQRDRVVTKHELLSALWQEQHVDEFAVQWTVSHARRLLGQGKGEQRPIRTVHGRGYRFVADVSVEGDAPVPSTDVPAPPPARPKAATTQEPRAATPFVGRDQVMQQLEACLVEAAGGRGACCVLVGEAGIGKTRCLDELSTRATERGFAVWSGRSVEATFGPVFWPWIQILRALANDLPILAEVAHGIIARLTVKPAEASSPAPNVAELEPDRFWQYDAIASLLQSASRVQPIMLVFDDLHWADAGSWELVRYLATELRRVSILVVCARREERGASRDPRAQQIRHSERIELATLSQGDVEQYLRKLTGVARPNPALCEAVWTVSLGNPWFLRETLRTLSARYGTTALATLEPSAVVPTQTALDLLHSRLDLLSVETRAVLALASVLGVRFEIEVLARTGELPVATVLAALESAQESGMIVLEPPQRAHFQHILLRSLLYDKLAIPERLRLHQRAAEELEQTLDPLHFGEIAHHYHCALPLREYARASAAAVRAADLAARAHAFADAALFLEWATLAQVHDANVPPRARAELLLRRAYTERMAGREAQARSTATSVFELARQHGYYDLIVGAARVMRISYALGCMPDPVALSALEEVLRHCPEHASPERVGALALLSFLPPYALDMEKSKALSAQAVTLARELDDATALREALHARFYALSGPDDIDALLATANSLLNMPGERPTWITAEALLASYRAHLYRCDLTAANAALDEFGREAKARGLAELSWHHDFFHAQRTFASGDFARSETLFATLATRGARLGLAQASILGGVAKALLANERGGVPLLAQSPNLDSILAGLLALPACYAATGARLAAELGRPEPARQILHQLAQRDFTPLVKDLGYVNALANLSVAAIILADRTQAKAIYERLRAYPHHNTPNGVVGFYEGSASRFLAGLAAFLGEHEHAKRHFDDAVAHNEQLSAFPQVARTCYEYARWLEQRGSFAAALPLKRRAIEVAERIGMQHLAATARAL